MVASSTFTTTMPHSQMIAYKQTRASDVTDALLTECRALFKGHYGRWSDRGPKPGAPIDLPIAKLREYLGKSGWIATARIDDILVGYAMVMVAPSNQGSISWVTQFVVHSDYQNQLIGSTILNSVWIASHYAWGIASANPYAIRALEKASRRRCDPAYIEKRTPTIKKILQAVPYLRDGDLILTSTKSVIDTKFYQDVSSVGERLKSASLKEPWRLGQLEDGHEWLAVTFREQPEIRWTDEEFAHFTNASFKIVHEAYERMAASNPQKCHAWAKPERANKEVDFLLTQIELEAGASVLDFGCGSGRHSFRFAEHGLNVVGVDFSATAIGHANSAKKTGNNPTFRQGDCRSIDLETQFDLGVCLYDVIGSFPDDTSNDEILRNLVSHIKPGGFVAFSVMSFDYTKRIAKHTVTTADVQEHLSELVPSTIMQTSGNVFDPDYFLLDSKSRVVYRRETFDLGEDLPATLVVRDRRYGKDEIDGMCKGAGLELTLCGFVRAGKLDLSLDQSAEPTKEVLVIARKSLI